MQSFIHLVKREVYRFMSIWIQTIIAPVSTSILYQVIFGSQLSSLVMKSSHVQYSAFLIPGLVMLQVIRNAFGNGSSSLIQSKYSGSIIFVLMAPISPFAMFSGYVIGSVIRGLVVGVAVFFSICWFGGGCIPRDIWIALYFLFCGAAIAGGLGVICGMLADKFEQLNGLESFLLIPLIYLAGVFFSPHNFSGIWRVLAYMDPFLYIIDGFRYGFIPHASTNIYFGACFVLFLAVVVNITGYLLFKKGIRIKH